ncbi:MAG TPA: EMC3/TMCO1 family protein [Thermoplasmata archaeon]|nr:EMC3/TMCO1 family protein [Thermoplasmata archaeon]
MADPGAGDRPLADSDSDADETEEPGSTETDDAEPTSAPARPPTPAFKPSTFLLTFLFVLGLVMLFDTGTRNGVATEFGILLAPGIGFHGHYPLLTMFLAAVIEMVLTALAYNWATDWFKAAKVATWGTAFRKVQMEAIRSGKKDRVEALKPHQMKFTQLSSEVSFAQLKGMAVTWFLVIAIYTWVGLFLAQVASGGVGGCPAPPCPQLVTVSLGGAQVNLLHQAGWPLPPWFILFSVYTVPMSLLFRRLLKHYTLRDHALKSPVVGVPSDSVSL